MKATQNGNILRITELGGALDIERGHELQKLTLAELQRTRCKNVEIDMTGAPGFSSGGLMALVEIHKTTSELGGTLTIGNAADEVLSPLLSVKISTFHIVPTLKPFPVVIEAPVPATP